MQNGWLINILHTEVAQFHTTVQKDYGAKVEAVPVASILNFQPSTCYGWADNN